jgi:hypothetical protein
MRPVIGSRDSDWLKGGFRTDDIVYLVKHASRCTGETLFIK